MAPSINSFTLLSLSFALNAAAYNYTMGVGKNEVDGVVTGVGFDPSRTVIAAADPAGDFLIFEMLSGTHRVVQTSFAAPCTPAAGGFDTQEVVVPQGTESDGQHFVYELEDSTDVLYFADIGGTNCQQGAVFCLNTDEGGAEACHVFKDNAIALGGGVVASTSGSSAASSSTTSSATSSSPSSDSSVTSAPSSSSPSSTRDPATGTVATTAPAGPSATGGANKVFATGSALAVVALGVLVML